MNTKYIYIVKTGGTGFVGRYQLEGETDKFWIIRMRGEQAKKSKSANGSHYFFDSLEAMEFANLTREQGIKGLEKAIEELRQVIAARRVFLVPDNDNEPLGEEVCPARLVVE